MSKSLPSLLAKADSTIPWTGQTMCLFADRGFTPQPICIKAQGSQGTGTNSQNTTWKQPRLLSEVFQHKQRCLRPFPCRYELLQPPCSDRDCGPMSSQLYGPGMGE